MSSVAGMMALTGAVSGGGGLVEAGPGGVLFTRAATYTFEVSASVAVPTYSGSGNTYYIPYSSNYCFATVSAGESGRGVVRGDGGQGGSLAYINGITLAVGDQITLTCTGPKNYGASFTYNTISWPGGYFSVTQRFGGQGQYSAAGSSRVYHLGGPGGAGAGTHWSNQNNPAGGGGGAANWSGGYHPQGASGSQGGYGLDPYSASSNSPSGIHGALYGAGGRGEGGSGSIGFCRIMYGLNRSFPSTDIGNGSSYTGGHADLQIT